ncbi:MAG: dTDP-glucose 4,6-dehydratase [Clostridia bacterium]|nr:dTDP-glucose 4,6-dehydratase [Clostridia bacterium]MDY6184837.1 dTDP-glucose 4,6-dehydratase [Eubacteriales bacterium]
MTYLVTGGAGFIGCHFVTYLLEKYPLCRVICVDSLTYAANPSTLKKVLGNPRFRFYHTDICDRAGIYEIFEKEHPDYVVNFAAESHVDRSIEDPALFLRTNVLGTGVLLDACRKYGNKRFHQVSTDEVYGALPLDENDHLFSEDSPLHASSPYSASKASADLLVLAYHRTYRLPVTISRSSNNFGPYQFPEKLIPLMILRALGDNPLPVYGDGRQVRDWIFVTDHCKAIDLILTSGRDGEVYNVGGQNERVNLDLVRQILGELGKPEGLITHVADRPGHDARYALDTSKIRDELGWHPETAFDDGLKETIHWYLDHRDWWEEIESGAYLRAAEQYR